MPPEVRVGAFEAFYGRQVTMKVEARGARIEIVEGRLDGVSTTHGISFFMLEGGRRLVRANSVVDLRLTEDAVAEARAIEAAGP